MTIDYTTAQWITFCYLAVVRSVGQLIWVAPHGSTVAQGGATLAPRGATFNIFMYLFVFIYHTM